MQRAGGHGAGRRPGWLSEPVDRSSTTSTVVVLGEQPVDEVRTEEAGATGDEHAHGSEPTHRGADAASLGCGDAHRGQAATGSTRSPSPSTTSCRSADAAGDGTDAEDGVDHLRARLDHGARAAARCPRRRRRRRRDAWSPTTELRTSADGSTCGGGRPRLATDVTATAGDARRGWPGGRGRGGRCRASSRRWPWRRARRRPPSPGTSPARSTPAGRPGSDRAPSTRARRCRR